MLKIVLASLLLTTSAMATEQAFPPAEIGSPEIVTLPAGLLLKSTGQGSYFDHPSDLFMPLFRYISSHDISMTVPVEARIDSAAMYFWVSEAQRGKANENAGGVEVVEVKERKVARLGARGGYSEANFNRTRDVLVAWLRKQKEVEPSGEPYAVFWNGPFLPGFLKRYEVHIPVRSVGAQ
jgi:hypothetical protein